MSVDLHIHTHFSDSTLSPREALEEAFRAGITCISITDHDTVEGLAPAIEEAKSFGIEVLSGVELSSEMDQKDIHILGYLFDPLNSTLQSRLFLMQNARVERMRKMIERLKTLGVDNIELSEVCALSQSRSVGRPHLAAVLLKKGWITSIREAFDRFIGEGGPAFAEKFKMTPFEAIELIVKAGGVAVLAHPMVTNRDELIPRMVEAGLKGIEVYYPNYSSGAISYYEGIAQKNNLIMTGGSDAHGAVKDNTFIGKIKIPYSVVEKLKQAAAPTQI